MLAADPEHDLQVLPPPQLRCGGVGQEAEELAGLVGARRHPQGLHGQAGVAHPGVAVIPVALAADRLRQRGRGRGHDGPGRGERERLQDPAGMMHQVAPGPLIGLVQSGPGAPSFHGVLQAGGDLAGLPGGQRRLLHLPVLEREAHGLPGDQVELRGGSVPGDLETGGRGKQEPAGAATGGDASGDRFQDRVDQPVFGPRRIADIDVDFPDGARELAQQNSRRPGAQVVAAVVAAHGHGVGQHRSAGLRPERGLQDHRLVDVRAADLEIAGRPDREVAAIGIKETGEYGRRVEARAT